MVENDIGGRGFLVLLGWVVGLEDREFQVDLAVATCQPQNSVI